MMMTTSGEAQSNGSVGFGKWRRKTMSMIVLLSCILLLTISVKKGENDQESACTSVQSVFSDLFCAVKMSLQEAQAAHEYMALGLKSINPGMSQGDCAASQDCEELFENIVYLLNLSASAMSSEESLRNRDADVHTWLSAALTNQDTCLNGFLDLEIKSSSVQDEVKARALKMKKLLRNSLALLKTAATHASQDFLSQFGVFEGEGFPGWLSAEDRRLLMQSPALREADVVVAKDGSGNYRTIKEAVDKAPGKSRRRYVIHVKAGVYRENVDVNKPNLMIMGDGKYKTIVTGNKNVHDGSTTYNSATFAVSGRGNGFIAKDMAFVNTAGAAKHQAVAIRVGVDHAVLYRCSFLGFQDTLYVYSLRQFYRECDVYGTVDFIFGNAAVVFQKCNIFVRKPMHGQKNTVTAQGREDPHQNTGISIHNCKITAASDLEPVKKSFKTYLGRPWRAYSRTVYMQSVMEDIIDPAGWLEWDGEFALKTLYYGEYKNSGVGAWTSKRVKWRGFRVIGSVKEAEYFTVRNFILGDGWIPGTGIDYISGLIE